MGTAVINLDTPGQIIRFCRHYAKIKQVELARILGHGDAHQTMVSAWENELQSVSAETMLKIIEVCGLEFTITPIEEFEESESDNVEEESNGTDETSNPD